MPQCVDARGRRVEWQEARPTRQKKWDGKSQYDKYDIFKVIRSTSQLRGGKHVALR